MNKTVTVNIGGLVFHIEEQAYEKLKKYLEAIRSYFTSSEGRDEIMQDIEGRIAEMLSERIKDSKQVVVDADVDHVINILGRPEQFVEGEEVADDGKTFAANIEEKRTYRKLYRDTDDKVLSGICAGIGHRLGIDPIWVRIAYLVFTFITFFTGVIVYLILSAIIPPAASTAQKLEMRGESVTVGSIRKEVESPAEKPDSVIRRFFGMLGELLKIVFKIIIYVIGGIFALAGIMILFSMFVLLLAVGGVAGISIPVIFSDLFLTSGQQFWAVLSVILVIGVPVFLLLYFGLKILFNIRKTGRVFKISALALWVFGLIVGMSLILRVAGDLSEPAKLRSELPLVAPATDTLFIDIMEDGKYEAEYGNHWHYGLLRLPRLTITTGDESHRIPNNAKLDIRRADGDEFKLVQIKSARGRTMKRANENASKIIYNMEQKDSLLRFSTHFPIPMDAKYRMQHVQLILYVPVGKSVHLNNDSQYIIYDIKNVTNTYDLDMINHTWTMTDRGLECKSCNLPGDSHEWNESNAHVRIDKGGIHIKAHDRDDTVNLQGEDVEIKIDEHGVIINAKE